MGVATIAVLFTDLVGSTEMAERLGPVVNDRLRRQHFELLRRAVAAHNGREIKSTGDGLMVVFQSPSDAAACASAMQASNERVGVSGSASFGMRVGVALGEATEDDGDWYGFPVVRAARLCAAAEAGQILVDQFVAALSEHAGVSFESRDALELKGISQPVATFELLWSSGSAPVPLPAGLAAATGNTFVARDQQLTILRAAWDRAAAGETVLTLLAGEPGAGKSSIAAELARELHDDGALVLFGRCDDGVGLAYQPFAQAMSHWVRHADDDVLAAHAEAHGGELTRLAPQLTARVPEAPAPVVGDPAGEQWRLFTAVHGLLQQLASARPVLLVLDDLHWATTPTLQLVTFLVRAESPAALLIVATYRDTELARTHPLADTLAELRTATNVKRVRVGGFDSSETERLVEAIAGHELDDAGRALARALHGRTEGNPFFAVEVLLHLAESGGVVFEDGRWRASDDIAAIGLPEGVKEVVGRRLGRLSDATNAVLSVASVAGLEFDAAVVAHVLDLQLVELLDALADATRAGIARETPQTNRFVFTHALIRTTVLDEAGASRRVNIHGRIANAIEAVHASNLEPWLADLAYHHAEAARPGRIEPAIEFAHRAAAQARRQAAISDAIGHLERGLAAARLADRPDPEQVAGLLIALADTTAVDSPARAREYATAAVEVAEPAGLWRLVGDAAASMWSTVTTRAVGMYGGDRWLLDLCERVLPHAAELSPIAHARVLAILGSHVTAYAYGSRDGPNLGDQALTLARSCDDPATLVIAAFSMSVGWSPSDAKVRWAEYLEAMDAAVAATDDHHLRGMAAVFTFWAASMLGDVERFHLTLSQVEAASEAIGGPRLRTWAAWMRTTLALRAGAWDDAIRLTTEARENTVEETIAALLWAVHVGTAMIHQGASAQLLPMVSAESESAITPSGMLAYRALVEALAGEHDRARVTLARLDADVMAADPFVFLAAGTATWAAAVVADASLVARLDAELAPYAGLICGNGTLELGAVDRFRGMLATLDGRHDDADGLFASGLALEEHIGAPVFVAQTQYWWAKNLLERDADGDRQRAIELLHACIETTDRLAMKQVGDDARALLDEGRMN